MADKQIRAQEGETVSTENQELRAEAKDIREEVQSGEMTPDAAESRLREIEARITDNERNMVELRAHADKKSDSTHDHPAHPELRALSEHLDTILREEKKPRAKSWFWGR